MVWCSYTCIDYKCACVCVRVLVAHRQYRAGRGWVLEGSYPESLLFRRYHRLDHRHHRVRHRPCRADQH